MNYTLPTLVSPHYHQAPITIKPPSPTLLKPSLSDNFTPALHLIGVNWYPDDQLHGHIPESKSELKQEAADLLFTDADSDAEFKKL